ncbi:2-dehydropantoate 2-reductase [Paenibacillus campi]|uniref:2-dehydropantoate 2-reductase n=1 Tax=Paenibacillus campi TaxID=3106031 RepID=UPI002AFF8F41|nr:2-dehydropantoate 2-reductase [Paenibacillus sp. SGZ-1014]
MHIDIVGGGSLGLLFFSKLALTRHANTIHNTTAAHSLVDQLWLWTRTSEQAKRIQEEGVLFQAGSDQPLQRFMPSSLASCSVAAVQTNTEQAAAAIETDKADIILLTVKQQHVTAELIHWLSKRMHKGTVLITMQNGLRTDSIWPPTWNVYVAITTEGAKKLSPVGVMHSGHGQTAIGNAALLYHSSTLLSETLAVQEYEQRTIASLLRSLMEAGFKVALSNNIRIDVYRKLTINAVINPLTALWRISNGELLASEARIAVMRQLFDEAIAVYTWHHIEWSEAWWHDILQVCQATAANTSSMLADVLHSKRTEIRWINGAIIELARRVPMQAFAHEWMCTLIESLTVEEVD